MQRLLEHLDETSDNLFPVLMLAAGGMAREVKHAIPVDAGGQSLLDAMPLRLGEAG
jgi:hypothetical protein